MYWNVWGFLSHITSICVCAGDVCSDDLPWCSLLIWTTPEDINLARMDSPILAPNCPTISLRCLRIRPHWLLNRSTTWVLTLPRAPTCQPMSCTVLPSHSPDYLQQHCHQTRPHSQHTPFLGQNWTGKMTFESHQSMYIAHREHVVEQKNKNKLPTKWQTIKTITYKW